LNRFILILLVFLGVSTYEKTNRDSSLNSDELKLSADGEAEVPCWTNLPHKKCAEASECCTGDCQPDGWCARNETKGIYRNYMNRPSVIKKKTPPFLSEVNIAVILACVHLLTLGFPFELGASYGVSIFLLVPDNTPLPCRVVWLCGPR